MAESTFDVIAAGHLCLDLYPQFATSRQSGRIADLLQPGTLIHMGEMTLSTGGAVSNVGIAMKIFGCRVGFVARVGADELGRLTIGMLQRSGSAEGIAMARGEPSSYTVVLAPPNIDRIFLHCPGTNDTFTLQDVNPDLVRQARLFHLGYPTLMRSLFVNEGEELARILGTVRRLGSTTSLDISLPDPNSEAGRADWRAIYRRALPYTDIFAPSVEEAFFTLHPGEYLQRKQALEGQELIDHISPQEHADLAAEFLSMGCAVAAIKAGHNGWYIRTAGRERLQAAGRGAPPDAARWAERELWCPAFQVQHIASAAGAGDSSIAGFLTGLLQGKSIESCLRLANAAGCMNLRAMDTLSGLLSWEELQAALPGLTPRANAFLGTAGWGWEQELAVWERR
jgi:sugar/nucleoside kinase (ribokinase family)